MEEEKDPVKIFYAAIAEFTSKFHFNSPGRLVDDVVSYSKEIANRNSLVIEQFNFRYNLENKTFDAFIGFGGNKVVRLSMEVKE